MTVEQLIEELKKFPMDEVVYVRDRADCNGHTILSVSPYDEDEERGPNWALAVEFDSE